MRLTSALKWHGGKFYLAKQIVALFPPRPTYCHYVETNFGSGAVMLEHDPEGMSEVANDIDGELTNFWRVLASPTQFPHFLRMAQATPFCEEEWRQSGEPRIVLKDDPEGDWRAALRFFVRCRQSRQGLMKDFATLTRNRTRRGMNEQVSAWLTAVEGLQDLHNRLKRLVVMNRDVKDLIRQQDGKKTLFYLDPPYLHETRSTTGEYRHEMSDYDHFLLLLLLSRPGSLTPASLNMDDHPTIYRMLSNARIQPDPARDIMTMSVFRLEGRFLLSGYHSPLYDEFALLNGWRCVEFDLPNNASSADSKERKIECVWMNY